MGAGTGILSELILTSFPNAKTTVFDLSEKMLETCGKKLAVFKDRLDFELADFLTDDFGTNYDLVVSGLAVHHIDDEGKRALFKRIFKSLNKGGTLLIRDCVTGATPDLTEKYENLWRAFMRENGEDDEKWFARHLEEDTPSSLSNQLTWLREAGFINVGCHWRYFKFCDLRRLYRSIATISVIQDHGVNGTRNRSRIGRHTIHTCQCVFRLLRIVQNTNLPLAVP